MKTARPVLSLPCSCGARAPILETKKGFHAHCPGCGAMTFWKNPVLVERVRLGGQLCPHHPETRPCKGGLTAWCPLCRIRSFYYDGQKARTP